MNVRKIRTLLVFSFVVVSLFTNAQSLVIDTSPDRVSTGLNIPFERVATIRPKTTLQTNNKYWTIGCETVDRDYTIYDEYKDYLTPLGIRKARFQCGWAKTEKVKGQYDFTWIDKIVDDMASRNIEMWAELSYGNPLYKGGGGIDLGGGLPSSEEALKAWDKWVEAMVTRYKGKIHEWEVWNEADANAKNTPEKLADFNFRTAQIIKRIDPSAKIAGLTLAGIGRIQFIEFFLKAFKKKNALDMIEWISFHGYPVNPDHLYGQTLEKAKTLIHSYAPHIKLRQGESGCPSEYQVKYHALREYHWSELTQAKWFLRRMMGDLGNDIDESSVFCMMDMVYLYDVGSAIKNGLQDRTDEEMNNSGKEKFKFFNRFGLIRCDSMKRAEKIKQSFYAVQNTISVFDQPLVRIKDSQVSVSAPKEITAFEYRNTDTKAKMFVIWDGTQIPADTYKTDNAVVSIKESNFKNPVWVDLLTGRVYAISSTSWKKKGDTDMFEVPVYDSPVVITDLSSLPI